MPNKVIFRESFGEIQRDVLNFEISWCQQKGLNDATWNT